MGYQLLTNTAARIPVGPLVDPTDGKTAETALDVTALSAQLYEIDGTGGTAVTRTQFTPTASGGANDMALVTSSTDGMYDLELTAAQLNFLGQARITFYDVDGFLVHYIDLEVCSANYFNNKFGSTIESVNTTQLAGVTQSLTDLKDFADAGYDPATNKVQGVLLTDTVTTYTGNVPQTADHTAGIADIPTVAEFEARTLVSADYTIVADLGVVQTADHTAAIADIPTVAETTGYFTEIKGATWASGTDTLEAIRNQGDAAWVTATGFATPTNITAGTITTVTNVTNAPTSGDLTATMKTSVNTEVADVLKTDTIAEQAQGIPPTTPTFEEAVMYLYMALTKQLDVTSTEKAFYNNAGTKVWKKTLSDDGTTYSETKGLTGA